MLNLVKSEYADSIYYADLFRINKEIWMVMGYGKSDAARIASGGEKADDIGRDCIAIRNNSGTLEGRYDPGAINPVVQSSLFDFYKIDHVVYCLSPDETEEIYQNNDKVMRSCPLEVMMRLCVSYPYPAYAAQAVFSPEELFFLADNERRSKIFQEVIASCDFGKLAVVPFMDEVEEKADLYKQIGISDK